MRRFRSPFCMRRRSIRVALVALLAVFAVTVAGLPAVSAAAVKAAPAGPSARQKAALAEAVGHVKPGTISPAAPGAPVKAPGQAEVLSLRTQTSDTFTVPGKGYQTVISPAPVNYKDDTGAWQPIDTTLIKDAASGFAWKNTAGDYAVEFPASLADGPVKVTDGAGRWVAFGLNGAGSTPGTVSGSTIGEAVNFLCVKLEIINSCQPPAQHAGRLGENNLVVTPG